MRFACLAVLLALTVAEVRLATANPAEQRAFAAANASFQLGLWERAEREFAEIVEKFPDSERLAEAVLRQAQARYRQTNSVGVVELLSARLDRAGRLADEFQFWIAEAHFQGGNYEAAAAACANLARQFTNSPRYLEASYNEALAWSRLGRWPRVIELVGGEGGAFQKAGQVSPTNAFVGRGLLLLGEAHLAQKDYRAAETTLQTMAERRFGPELEWRRQYLLCRVQLAAGRPAEALQGATNLLALAAASSRNDWQAESAVFQAGLFEQAGQPASAIAAYELNLTEASPAERRRQALLKIIELLLAQNKTAEAVQRLEKFSIQYPNDSAADVTLLALGELYLKQHLADAPAAPATNAPATVPAATNRLQQALARFDTLLKDFPQSPLTGKAHLGRGWCLWFGDQLAESQAALQAAVEQLPPSEDQAVARFKWADCQFRLKDVAGALSNYRAIIQNYGDSAQVNAELFEPALYQIVRAGLQLSDLAAATNALATLFARHPDGLLYDRSALLAGQQMNPTEARQLFAQVKERVPNSPLLPEIELAIARTHEQEGNWVEAIHVYDAWLTNYVDQAARPRAEFYRAWAHSAAGHETNALHLFTGFVAQFPTNDLAPLAQNWVADHYFRLGDFKSAEENYQLLFKKWPASRLAYQAQMMAGRAAVARDGLRDAAVYFTGLINDEQCPPDVLAQAFFAYGDTLVKTPPAETNKPSANFEEAIRVFSKIQQLFKTNEVTALAWGRIGDCYLQLGSMDAKNYDEALHAYRQVLESPEAGVAARSQAEVGIGDVLEKQARSESGQNRAELRKRALDHYVNVTLGTNLRDGERRDPFWVKTAGLAAGTLLEELQQWEQAANLYRRLIDLLPPLRPMLEKRIYRVQEQLGKG